MYVKMYVNKKPVIRCLGLAVLAVAMVVAAFPVESVFAQDQTRTQVQTQTCESCHAGAARDWSRSKMAGAMDCSTCHGSEHNKAENARLVKTPTPATCQKCHSKQVEQFASGKHALGWKALEVVPNFAKLPAPVAQSGCIGCHQVGYIWADGSQGKCDSCHTRHSFSAAEANEPEACGTCHAGDHPQYDIWSNSKHGKLYQMTRDGSRAPKCQTCHMQGGDHKAITAWGFLGMRGEEPDPEWRKIRGTTEIILKLIGPGNAPGVTRQTYAEWQVERQKMLDTCSGCHATSFARRALERGDAVIKESDKVFGQIGMLTLKLRNERAIDDKTQSAILREALAYRFSAYMGTFHGAYRYAWDEGYLPLTDALVELGERVKR